MRTVAISKSLTAASANCIAAAQTIAAAGNAVLNGGSVTTKPLGAFGADVTVAALDTQRRIQIISDGNDSGKTAHVYGFRQNGQPINEILTLTNAGTVISGLDYFYVGPTIAFSAAVANHITIGTNGTGSTDWIAPSVSMDPFEVDIANQVTGTVTWGVDTTQDQGWYATPSGQAVTPQPNVNAFLAGATAAQPVTLNTAITGFRYTITSGTGTLVAQSVQPGISNY